MKTYKIQDRVAGNVIETGLTETEAKEMLKRFEETDKQEGAYSPDFYEIVEEAKFKAQPFEADPDRSATRGEKTAIWKLTN
jgi:hypothetical protein